MKLYIGNLDYHTEESELKELFGKYGQVNSVVIIKDKYTGQAKGFGFVEMENKRESLAAIKELHDFELNDRNLIVNEARAKN